MPSSAIAGARLMSAVMASDIPCSEIGRGHCRAISTGRGEGRSVHGRGDAARVTRSDTARPTRRPAPGRRPATTAAAPRFKTEHGRDNTAALSAARALFIVLGVLANRRNGFPTAAAIGDRAELTPRPASYRRPASQTSPADAGAETGRPGTRPWTYRTGGPDLCCLQTNALRA